MVKNGIENIQIFNNVLNACYFKWLFFFQHSCKKWNGDWKSFIVELNENVIAVCPIYLQIRKKVKRNEWKKSIDEFNEIKYFN